MLNTYEIETLKLKIEIRELVATLLDLSMNDEDLQEVRDFLKEKL